MECVGNTDATRRQRSCRQAVTRSSGSAAGGATLKHHRWAFFVLRMDRLDRIENSCGTRKPVLENRKGKERTKGAKVRARSFSPGGGRGGGQYSAIWPMAIWPSQPSHHIRPYYYYRYVVHYNGRQILHDA